MSLALAGALVLGAVTAVLAGPVVAQDDAEHTAAQRCFEHHKFGRQPVDVAKSADGQTVLAQVSWGYHDSIGCYLTLDNDALAALRAAPAPQDLPDTATDASQRCFEHHKFGLQPVDVAKTADRQTVLARLRWGYHDAIGCYLVLDDTALTTLRANAANPTTQPDAIDTMTVGVPPTELGFDEFYGKYLDAGSLPIIASAQVPDEALVQVKRLVEEMLGDRDDILVKFREYNIRVAVMVEGSGVTELPELSDLYEVFPGTDWDERTRGGGVGPTYARPVVAIAEEHLLCYDSDVFPFEDIFVHEFAHGVLNMGIELLPGGRDF